MNFFLYRFTHKWKCGKRFFFMSSYIEVALMMQYDILIKAWNRSYTNIPTKYAVTVMCIEQTYSASRCVHSVTGILQCKWTCFICCKHVSFYMIRASTMLNKKLVWFVLVILTYNKDIILSSLCFAIELFKTTSDWLSRTCLMWKRVFILHENGINNVSQSTDVKW